MERLRDKLVFIANNYGDLSQMEKTIEECAELQKAILKYKRNPNTRTRDDIIDEIADVGIMLEQMKIILSCEDEAEIRTGYKIERQMDRIRYEQSKE